VRVASLKAGGRDGTLALVSASGDRVLPEPGGIRTFQALLDDWAACEPILSAESARLEDDPRAGRPVEPTEFHSPLPRAYQWCEGSTYLPHIERTRRARGLDVPPELVQEPAVYQSGAARLLGPLDPIPLPDEAWGLDLEATVACITGDVPVGTTAKDASAHVLFLVLTNDLTYRNLLPAEVAKGLGPHLSKPTRAYAPLAVSATSLGDLWDGGLLRATVKSWVNGELLGAVDSASDTIFDFPAMIEYLARTRELPAGTIVGTGAVSNEELRNGFACLAEKRAIELLTQGEAVTPWLVDGDTVRIEAFDSDGRSLFGAVDQAVVAT
jgi:fumarylacetoacetate (FAA) hydrolase